MGCDIHIFAEYKVGDGPWIADKKHTVYDEEGDPVELMVPDTWYQVDSFGCSRNYSLFGFLAGVRAPGPKSTGAPDDVSEMISLAIKLYGEDGHNHSSLSLRQFKIRLTKAGYKMNKKLGFDIDNSPYGDRYPILINYLEHNEKKLKVDIEAEKELLGQDVNTKVKTRIVFFFDN